MRETYNKNLVESYYLMIKNNILFLLNIKIIKILRY